MIRRHLTLPNNLTFLRLLLIPVIGFSLTADFAYHYQLSTAVYAGAAVTDTLDGRIARARKSVSELGKFLDPLADKILVITVLAILLDQRAIESWVLIVIFAREFLITGLRTVAASQGVVMGSSVWGKSKTLSQNCMIGMILLALAYPVLTPAAHVLVAVAVVLTILSGLDFLWRYRRFVI